MAERQINSKLLIRTPKTIKHTPYDQKDPNNPIISPVAQSQLIYKLKTEADLTSNSKQEKLRSISNQRNNEQKIKKKTNNVLLQTNPVTAESHRIIKQKTYSINSSEKVCNFPVVKEEKTQFAFQSPVGNGKLNFDVQSYNLKSYTSKRDQNTDHLFQNQNIIQKNLFTENLNDKNEFEFQGSKIVNGKYFVNAFCLNHPDKKVKYFIPGNNFINRDFFTCKAFCSKCAVNLMKEEGEIEEIKEVYNNECNCGICNICSLTIPQETDFIPQKSFLTNKIIFSQREIKIDEQLIKNQKDCLNLKEELKTVYNKINERHCKTIQQVGDYFKEISLLINSKTQEILSQIDSNFNRNSSLFLGFFKKLDYYSWEFQNIRDNFGNKEQKTVKQTLSDNPTFQNVSMFFINEKTRIENLKFFEVSFSNESHFINDFKKEMDENLKIVFNQLYFRENFKEEKENLNSKLNNSGNMRRNPPEAQLLIRKGLVLQNYENTETNKAQIIAQAKISVLKSIVDQKNYSSFKNLNEKRIIEIDQENKSQKVTQCFLKNTKKSNCFVSVKNYKQRVNVKLSEENLMESETFKDAIIKNKWIGFHETLKIPDGVFKIAGRGDTKIESGKKIRQSVLSSIKRNN